ncbi:MAG TPA: hypothetical protein VFU86_14315 [Terriglobales bacterium]|nr:hypothetical protein [Terriglobales bacterium]
MPAKRLGIEEALRQTEAELGKAANLLGVSRTRSDSDEAIHFARAAWWIASLRSQ